MKTGILGLGLIGSAWAKNLQSDGALTACWNRSPGKDFPELCETPDAVASVADVLIVVVTDPPAVDAVLRSIELTARHTVVQSSTIDPASSNRFCEYVRATGARYVEAPFTGSGPAAAQRKTIFYLGGRLEDIAVVEPVLARISQLRVRIGEPSQAATFKLSQNIVAANYAQALCESLQLSRSAGIPDPVFFDALRPTVVWNGLATLKEPKLRTGDFSAQFTIKNMLKDMRLALGGGDASLPLTRTVETQLQRAVDAGLADEDYIAVIKLLPGPARGVD